MWFDATEHFGMTIQTVSTNTSYGGVQGVYRHASQATGTDMVFSVYVPPHAAGAKLPVVWYLSGLTCTHANVTEKGEFRKACAELGHACAARRQQLPDGDALDAIFIGAISILPKAGFVIGAFVVTNRGHGSLEVISDWLLVISLGDSRRNVSAD